MNAPTDGIKERMSKPSKNKHQHDHNHDHGKGINIELLFAILCGVFLIVGFLIEKLTSLDVRISIGLYIISYFFGGYYTTMEAYHDIMKGKFEIDFLMLFAAIGAAILGEWAEGALLLFLFSLGHSLEHFAMNRARNSIAALSDLAPPTAILLTGGSQKEVPVETLKVGDIILVKPNSKIGADGVIIDGASSINQAPITGESVPVDKFAITEEEHPNFDKIKNEHKVYAGTINGSSVLEVKVLRLNEDSTLSRLVKMVSEAEEQKSPTQHFTDKFERYFVPIVLVIVLLLMFAFTVIDEPFSASFYRAMAVLVSASPCALAISTPSAVLAGVARAAKSGLLVKGGKPLENLGKVDAVAFDKTGTLTEGKPKLTTVIPRSDVSEAELLEAAIAVESLSDHPLAEAIVKGGKERIQTEIEDADDLEAITARGVKATFKGKVIHMGNRLLMREISGKEVPKDIDEEMSILEEKGHTAMIVMEGSRYLGIIAVMDIARSEVKETLSDLKKIGVAKMVMLTGDHQSVANAIAEDIGITDPVGNLLPEDKVKAIKSMTAAGNKVAMVGDGVNDAPAMAASTVGIAMGAAGSAVALETAEVALMADKLNKLPFALKLSKQVNRIIRQNLWISLGMVAVLMPLTITGIATMGPAVVAHEGSTLVVVLNALRLLGFKE